MICIKWQEEQNKSGPNHHIHSLLLPDLVAFVLVADGQQVQQDFIEVAKGEVNAHHCNCVSRSHLRAEERDGEQAKEEETSREK